MKDEMRRIIINHLDIEMILVNNEISLIRFSLGGAPIFLADKINHHSDMAGKIASKPLLRTILREWDVSYDIFANANRAEEQSP